MTPKSTLRLAAIAASVAFAACSGSTTTSAPQPGARMLVTAGTSVIDPDRGAAPVIDLTALGADRMETYYRLTTPADTPLRFELVSWRTDASGTAQIVVRHVRDGADEALNDGFSWPRAGLLAQGSGITGQGAMIAATGDGMARLSIQGRITQNQVFAVMTEGSGVAIVEIAIGPASSINQRPNSEPEAGVILRETIYSSPSWNFGLPTVAVSGDRTSIVCYEGDRQDPTRPSRYELRLQHDAATGAVTGGASVSTSPDAGNWRDHEIVALYNVLGVVRSEAEGVRVRLSFDRGATFAQDVQLLSGFSQSRLVQAAMAADYSLAVAAWRARNVGGGLEFVVVEGRPQAFDAFGSPTWFQFSPAQVLYTAPADASPLTTGIAWSEGGDLAIGYAANSFQPTTGAGWLSTTEFRSAVRRYGETFVDTKVDEQSIFGMDPTVAVLGSGANLQVFYAYEVTDGIRLAVSQDGGASYSLASSFGQMGDHLPSVFVREQAGKARVDVLYLANRENGLELHRAAWLDWASGAHEEVALTKAVLQQVQIPPTTYFGPFIVPQFSTRVTQVGWLGYDAVLDGDQIVVAYDETTFDNIWMTPWLVGVGSSSTTGVSAPIFSHATPPPLAPGLTEAMPAPVADHTHQLKLMRLE